MRRVASRLRRGCVLVGAALVFWAGWSGWRVAPGTRGIEVHNRPGVKAEYEEAMAAYQRGLEASQDEVDRLVDALRVNRRRVFQETLKPHPDPARLKAIHEASRQARQELAAMMVPSPMERQASVYTVGYPRIAAVALVPVAAMLGVWAHRRPAARRRRLGLCAACGYDLRAVRHEPARNAV